MGLLKKISSPLFASLTLGLMPFVPEPHIVGKLRWIVGGADGMQPMDWFDVALHGMPWLWLLYTLSVVLIRESRSSGTHKKNSL